MEVLGSILGSAVAEANRCLCGCICSCIKNTVRFHSNLNALGNKMECLIELQNKVEQELEVVEVDENSRMPQVEDWLRKIERIKLQVNSLQAIVTTNNEKLCASFLNCTLRCRLSNKLANMLKEVERLLQAGSFPAGMVAVNPLPRKVRHIPGASVENQTTVSKTLAKIMTLLSEDGISRIGIWGMGGVGKTTIMRIFNNKLESTSSTLFGMVIWVTVSKKLDLIRFQTQIAERLRLSVSSVESQVALASRLHERLMKEKKFLLILDDVWDIIDLDSLGIPQAEIHKGSKIVLTSRSLIVCEGMKVDVKVKVEVLNDEEAWQLFTKNAGSIANSEDIREFAEAVSKECNRLPLALITVGSALRGKAKIELWKNALNELRRSQPSIPGIEKDVYKPLKWSYDSLHDKNMKLCFLYCSLFPEDFSIEVSQLAQYWLAEGLIEEQLNYEDSLNRGITIVENLKDLCLLEPGMEEGTVKMHDVIRDVAIWIASSSDDGCKFLVRSGIGLSQISEDKLLKSCERISFMNNEIRALPGCVIQCSNTSTLFLQGNFALDIVPWGFLVGFQLLKVLNMSGTLIQSLPLSLTRLSELRALLLRDCKWLEALPQLGGLRKLRVLDLHGTGIKELPKGLEELSNLRQLDLGSTGSLQTIQAGVVSRLFGLEVLDMSGSGYKWGVKGEVDEGQATFEELGSLQWLTVLKIWCHSIPCPSSVRIERLIKFQIDVSSHRDPEYSFCKYKERQLILNDVDLSEKQIRWLLINTSNLVLDSCREIGWMLEYLASNSEGFDGLKSLNIGYCDSIGPLGGCAAQQDLLPNLEEFYLHVIHNLECVWPLVAPLGLRFSKLRFIKVGRCPNLKYLFPYDLILYLINLEEIFLYDCREVEKLFEYSSGRDPVPSKLRILELTNLPALRTICREKESWQSLERVEVINCNQLRRLPLTTQNAGTIQEIRGEEEWWSQLEWDDDHSKRSLLPFFKPRLR